MGPGVQIPSPRLLRNPDPAPWSRGLRHRPFTAVTRVRIPTGSHSSFPTRAFSSVGQSGRLITGWSRVRVPEGPLPGPVAQLGRAPACHVGGRGFEPLPGRTFIRRFYQDGCAGVAQLAERLICNQQVAGSSPIASSILLANQRNTTSHGRVPEWPKGADCKSAVTDFGGSNPPPSTFHAGMAELADAHDSGSCVLTHLQVQVLFPAPETP